MTNDECLEHLEDIKYAAGINQRYHQKFQWWWAFGDKTVRIAVGILAVAGVWIALRPDFMVGGVSVAFISLIAAIVLNIVPFAEREQFYGDLFRRWGELRKDVKSQILKLGGRAAIAKPTAETIERLREFAERENCLHAAEPAPWRWLLSVCQGDENESLFGKGLREPRDIEAERTRRLAIISQVSLGTVPAGAVRDADKAAHEPESGPGRAGTVL